VPAGVAYRRRIQNSRDKRANVLYPVGLRVEHGDDSGITPEGGGGGAVEEKAVVGASCREVVEACSSLRRRTVVRTQARTSTA
jgi:hypothetical protein